MAGLKSTIIIKLVTANISNPVLPLETLAASSAIYHPFRSHLVQRYCVQVSWSPVSHLNCARPEQDRHNSIFILSQ